MSVLKGFWSYVHEDDDAEDGRIVKLAQDLADEYQMITGEEIKLFLDRNDIEWGDDWQKKIDTSLESVAFFIPVLTPRFFLSSECRRELNYFVRQADKLGLRGIIMPILYVDVSSMHQDNPSDDAIGLIKPFQREDWRELRLHSPKSPLYRSAVAGMANKLAAANTAAEETDTTVRSGLSAKGSEDPDLEEPGDIDSLAVMEETMPKWKNTIEEIGKNISSITPIMSKGTSQLQANDKKGGGLAGRLKILMTIAQTLSLPATLIEELGQQYSTQLYDVDTGIRLLIKNSAGESKKDVASAKIVSTFFTSIQNIADANNATVVALQGMLDATAPLEGMSRDLRKPLRSIRRGLTSMIEGQEVINSWVDMVGDSP